MSIWVEKYRPKRLEDLILPTSTKKQLQSVVEGKSPLINYLLSGPPGTGKSSFAKLLPKVLDLPYLYINASEENGVDIIRNKIKNFAISQSIEQKMKIVILDEADGISQSGMAALRNVIESVSKSTRFILTCNYPEKIISPLHSRLKQIEFYKVNDKLVLRRAIEILKAESISISKEQGKNLVKLIKKYHPDIRKIFNHLQYFSSSGEVDIIFEDTVDLDIFEEIMDCIITKKFSALRNILRNTKMDYSGIVRKIYNEILSDNSIYFKEVNEGKRAEAILLCADCIYKGNMVTDAEINFAAFCVEIARLGLNING